MSTIANMPPEIVAYLMESEIDQARADALEANRLTPDLLYGHPIVKAVRADPPYVKEGQLGVTISQDNAALVVLIVADHPTVVRTRKTNWVKTDQAFKNTDQLRSTPAAPTPTVDWAQDLKQRIESAKGGPVHAVDSQGSNPFERQAQEWKEMTNWWNSLAEGPRIIALRSRTGWERDCKLPWHQLDSGAQTEIMLWYNKMVKPHTKPQETEGEETDEISSADLPVGYSQQSPVDAAQSLLKIVGQTIKAEKYVFKLYDKTTEDAKPAAEGDIKLMAHILEPVSSLDSLEDMDHRLFITFWGKAAAGTPYTAAIDVIDHRWRVVFNEDESQSQNGDGIPLLMRALGY